MRLLSTTTGELVWFSDKEMRRTPYAILSHVWDKSEQSYQDVSSIPPLHPIPIYPKLHGPPITPPSLSHLNPKLSPKIRGACIYASSLGFKWIWIDTCCIDKTSSAELSEAINSMFKWYAKATVCIAYLQDVRDPVGSEPARQGEALPLRINITKSRWFTRGWTLQELVAPRVVVFVSRGWRLLGTKAGMATLLERRTHVDAAVLRSDRALSDVCVADRMRWAAGRETTRVEDRAYSLLGIFGVYLPTLYGEGEAAFQRLQEAIMTSSADMTLFMWDRHFLGRGLLASMPDEFAPDPLTPSLKSLSVTPIEEIPASADAFLGILNPRTTSVQTSPSQLPRDTPSFTKTSHGVRAWIPLIRSAGHDESVIAVMAVKRKGQYQGLVLQRASTTQTLHHYTVARTIAPSALPEAWLASEEDMYSAEWADIYVTDAALPNSPLSLSPATLNIPRWVLSRMSHDYDFYLWGHGVPDLESGVTVAETSKTRRKVQRPHARTFTFASVDPHSREPETLQVEFSSEGPAQGGAALLGFYIGGVTLNGRKTDLFPRLAPPEDGGGTLWFGDEDRAVGFTALSSQNDIQRELDITLAGRVYERCEQIHGARWRAPSPVADDSVRPPSSPSTPDSSLPTAAGEDLSEVWGMINDAMTELVRVVPRLAAAEAEIARLKGERLDHIDESTLRRSTFRDKYDLN